RDFAYPFYNKASARREIDRLFRLFVEHRYTSSERDTTIKQFFPDFYSVPRYIWLDRPQIEILTGHGNFAFRLWLEDKVNSPYFSCCPTAKQTAAHMLLECPISSNIPSNLRDTNNTEFQASNLRDYISPQCRYRSFKNISNEISSIISQNAAVATA